MPWGGGLPQGRSPATVAATGGGGGRWEEGGAAEGGTPRRHGGEAAREGWERKGVRRGNAERRGGERGSQTLVGVKCAGSAKWSARSLALADPTVRPSASGRVPSNRRDHYNNNKTLCQRSPEAAVASEREDAAAATHAYPTCRGALGSAAPAGPPSSCRVRREGGAVRGRGGTCIRTNMACLHRPRGGGRWVKLRRGRGAQQQGAAALALSSF